MFKNSLRIDLADMEFNADEFDGKSQEDDSLEDGCENETICGNRFAVTCKKG